MSLTRATTWTLLLAAGFALTSLSAARGQEALPPLPKKPDSSVPVINKHRESIRGGIPKGELPAAQDAFKAYAKYQADLIAHPAVWKASQDLKFDLGTKIPTIDGQDGILHEIDRVLLTPVPGGAKPNYEPADYIREFGAALDAALREKIEKHPERIVRVNAARVLAHVSRSGAPAHFNTVTALLASPATPTEIKYYLFHAATALLAAIDPTDLKVRKHAVEPKLVGALVRVLEDCVNKPALLLSGYKPETATPDQLQVIGMVRRQAVRALAQVKFVRIPTPEDRTKFLYPSYTLVRVAMADPALVPAPGPAESAEAVMGLCRMAPVEWQGDSVVPVKEYNPSVAVEAIIKGLITFSSPVVAAPGDRTLPWRAYALRIAEALTQWRALFNPDFNILQPNKVDASLVPPSVEELIKFVLPQVLAPMEAGMGQVNVPGLNGLLSDAQKNPKRKTTLFEGVKETSIDFASKK